MGGGENGLMRDREVAKRGSSGAGELTDSALRGAEGTEEAQGLMGLRAEWAEQPDLSLLFSFQDTLFSFPVLLLLSCAGRNSSLRGMRAEDDHSSSSMESCTGAVLGAKRS